jgi:hypothetical protein
VLRRGVAALVDGRGARSATGSGIDPRVREAIIAEAKELADSSDVRKMQFRARVASRLARESGEPLELPASRQPFNRIVDEALRAAGLFRLPAKSRRSAAAAPSEGLGSLAAERPGEVAHRRLECHDRVLMFPPSCGQTAEQHVREGDCLRSAGRTP